MAEPRAALPHLGSLEQEVKDILWNCPAKVCARGVLQQVTSHTLAYTTVATVLINLVSKGMVERIAVDRTWAYRPLHSRSSNDARLMIQALTSSECRAATLELFVQTLSDDDAALLRGILAAPCG
ncbi:MAG: BlaI/MecI/CopY family transcriptional regulator [Cellulomonas sp.]|nr:BlaI/MecI/CopY family transcriptional regulator [Cellulomonas sp.]